MISARDLAGMRATQDDAMPDLITIQRRVMTDDGFGGYNETSRLTIATDVACRITPSQQLEGLGQLGRPVEVASYIVRVPIGTDVRDEDFIIRKSDSVELQLERVKVPRSWDTLISCEAEIVS